MMLWASAIEKGYSAPIWMTYNQAAEIGGQVRKGETGSLVVYAATFTKTVTDENGDAEEKAIPFMKGYTVFNVEQIDGLPGHFYAVYPPPGNAIDRLDAADRAIGHLHGYQSPTQDAGRQPSAAASDYARTLDATARRAPPRGQDRGIDR
jgi:antirestriction protein ArdC